MPEIFLKTNMAELEARIYATTFHAFATVEALDNTAKANGIPVSMLAGISQRNWRNICANLK